MATGGQDTVLESVLECPICLETLTDPKMLSCFHFFCNKCIKADQSADDGVTCPVCRKVSTTTELHNVPIVRQILEACTKTVKTAVCEGCDEKPAKWRCVDCKQNFCEECRYNTHDRVRLLRSHQWQDFDSSFTQVVNKLVFCKIHKSKPVELHCKTCNLLICLRCATDQSSHKPHHTEEIHNALDRILPQIKDAEKIIKESIERLHSVIKKANSFKARYN